MRVLHLAVHLGGGIGRAHAALAAEMPPGVEQTFLLLQEPVDRWHVDEIQRRSTAQVLVGGHRAASHLARDADVVQVEWWGHPLLDECLGRLDLAGKRVVVWCHVSGLFPPHPPAWLVDRADRFMFTSPVSTVTWRFHQPLAPAGKFSVVNSGFGFTPGRTTQQRATPGRVAYLGTVDFKKMHPGAFDALDAVDLGAPVHFWGRTSAEAAARAGAMRCPERAVLMGHTEAPRAALELASVLLYPLRSDHYGTAENALVEAMSLGVVPVVLRNPAECAIVEDGRSGVVADTVEEAVRVARRLVLDNEMRASLSRGAAARAAEKSPARSAAELVGLWRGLVAEYRGFRISA